MKHAQLRWSISACAALVMLACAHAPLYAMPPFYKEFQAKFINPDADDEKAKQFAKIALAEETGQCLICHVKDQEKTVRNPFGAALAELLDKDNFKQARLDAEPEKVKQEIQEALDKVAALKVDPAKDDSPTFGELIAQGRLPGLPLEDKPEEKKEEPAPDAEKPAAQPDAATDKAEGESAEQAAATAGAAGLAERLIAHLKSELKAELRKELEPEIREELRSQLRAQLKTEIKAQLKDSLKAVVMAELGAVGNVPSDVEAQAIEQIRQLGGTVMPLAQNDDSKIVAFHLSGTELTDEGLAHLKSINKLVELNLKDTKITNEGLAQLAHITTLARLNLARTQASDEGLRHLKGLDNIAYLNLYGTQVSDAGMEHLVGMTNLRNLYLWQSQVTEEGAKRLQEDLLNCDVNYGQ